jgi:hypothetical protein
MAVPVLLLTPHSVAEEPLPLLHSGVASAQAPEILATTAVTAKATGKKILLCCFITFTLFI